MPFRPAFKAAFQPAFQSSFGDGGLAYTLADRVLDLTSGFLSTSTTVTDQSPFGNDATLYSGRYASYDGIGYYTTFPVSVAVVSGEVLHLEASVRNSIAGNFYWDAVGSGTLPLMSSVGLDTGSSWLRTRIGDGNTNLITCVGSGTLTEITVGKNGTNFFVGDLSDLVLKRTNGEILARWQLNDSADANLDGYPALDSSGNGFHGTHVGCAGGTGEATILQTAGMDWNKYRRMETTDKITFSLLPSSVYGTNARTIEFMIVEPSRSVALGDLDALIGFNNSTTSGAAFIVAYEAGYIAIGVFGGRYRTTSMVDVGDSVSIHVPASANLSDAVVEINGVSAGWTLASGSDVALNTTSVGSVVIGESSSVPGADLYEGIVSNFVVKDSTETPVWGVLGYGDTPWADTVGSNDGTESGTFSNYLVPSSDTTPTLDVFGNAIANPRPTADTWNLFGDGACGSVVDADSLDVTTAVTWEIWGNFYGTVLANETYMSRYEIVGDQRSFLLHKNATNAADAVTLRLVPNGVITGFSDVVISGIPDSVGCLTITFDAGAVDAYFNANAITAPDSSVLSIHAGTSDLLVGAAVPSSPADFTDRQISRPKTYKVALTADQVLQNFNAQEGRFGLY